MPDDLIHKAYARIFRDCHQHGAAPRPTREDATNAFHDLEEFRDWYRAQPAASYPGTVHVNRTLLDPDSKVYSAATCALLPADVHAFVKPVARAGRALPDGVRTAPGGGVYTAHATMSGQSLHIATCASVELALASVCAAKAAQALELAEQFHPYLCPRTLHALQHYASRYRAWIADNTKT